MSCHHLNPPDHNNNQQIPTAQLYINNVGIFKEKSSIQGDWKINPYLKKL